MRWFWQSSHDEALRRLWDDGHKAKEIARLLGFVFPDCDFSKMSVIGRANRLGFPPRKSGGATKGYRRYRNKAVIPKLPKVKPVDGRELGGWVVDMRGTRVKKAGRKEPTFAFVPHPTPEMLEAAVPLIQRTHHQCAYPYNYGTGPETLMCGAPVHRDSLCLLHHELCWRPVPHRKFPRAHSNPETRRIEWETW